MSVTVTLKERCCVYRQVGDMSGRVGDLSPKQAEALEQVSFTGVDRVGDALTGLIAPNRLHSFCVWFASDWKLIISAEVRGVQPRRMQTH